MISSEGQAWSWGALGVAVGGLGLYLAHVLTEDSAISWKHGKARDALTGANEEFSVSVEPVAFHGTAGGHEELELAAEVTSSN